MRPSLRSLVLGTLCLGSHAQEARPPDPLPIRVDRAIERGVAWLRTKQDDEGSFGLVGGQPYENAEAKIYVYPAGVTSLALLTLLKCGVPPDDAHVRRGFAYLRKHCRAPESTYELAMLALALEAKADPHKRERTREASARREGAAKPRLSSDDHKWMESLARGLASRWKEGGWRYGRKKKPPFGIERDMHQTQLAIMALAGAHRLGIDLPKEMVRDTVVWVLDQQEAEGPRHERWQPPVGGGKSVAPILDDARGWAYARGSTHYSEGHATGVMTAAGIVALVLGRRMLEDLDPRALRDLAPRIEDAIRDGFAWMDLHWSVQENPPGETPGGRTKYRLLWLYGVERSADLMRVHLIGSHDWYAEGAEFLLGEQQADGRWDEATTHPPRDVLNTCFALLFLDRATAAVTTPSR